MKHSFPEDLRFDAVKHGTRWRGTYSIPGMKNRKLQGDFDTEAQALRASGAAMCGHFRDNTTGWRDQPLTNKSEIEKIFGKSK